METIIKLGVVAVLFALVFYSIGILTEQRNKVINKTVLIFLSLGLFFDIAATGSMIIGSSNSMFTFHGVIGYAGLIAMTIETILAYRFNSKNGAETKVGHALHQYSRYAYDLWVIVFITGSMLAMK